MKKPHSLWTILFEIGSLVAILFALFLKKKVPVADGLGWDGAYFADTARKVGEIFSASNPVTTIFMQRSLPSILVGGALKLLGLESTAANLVLGFMIYDWTCALIGWVAFARICQELQISARARILAFSVCFITFYFFVDYPYHPVTTDPLAFCLGLWSFYFYLKKKTAALLALTVLCGFTWPSGYMTGLVLVAFPRDCRLSLTPAQSKWALAFLQGGSALLFGYLYWKWVMTGDREAPGATKIQRNLLPLSALVAFGFVMIANTLFVRGIRGEKFEMPGLRTWIMVACMVGLHIARGRFLAAHSAPADDQTVYFLRHFFAAPLVSPGQFLAAHMIFFGPIVTWVLFNSSRLFGAFGERSLGLKLVFWVTLIFMLNSQTRHHMYHFPFFAIWALHLCASGPSRATTAVLVAVGSPGTELEFAL